MKNHTQGLSKYALLLTVLLLIVIFSSCIPLKKLKLVQKKDSKDTTEYFVVKPRPKNLIQPFDNLYIKVISPDEITSRMFNSESSGGQMQNVNYHMISYTVNDTGYITLPYVGVINVLNLSILQAKDTIQNALSKYISNATVIVKFVGKSVTIVGEVTNQGEYVIFDDNINILTAIAQAGGLTDFGDRENVTVIRENNSIAKYHKLDLTDKHLPNSDFYYLKPEDILIIPPLKHKSFGFSTFPYALAFTAITTIIAILSFNRTL